MKEIRVNISTIKDTHHLLCNNIRKSKSRAIKSIELALFRLTRISTHYILFNKHFEFLMKIVLIIYTQEYKTFSIKKLLVL